MIENAVRQLGTEQDHPTLHLVGASFEALVVPEGIKSKSTHLAIVSDLINWALPQKVLVLSGCLQKSKSDGAGLTVTLLNKRSGRIVAAQTLWQKTYDPDMPPPADGPTEDDYRLLVEPAAVWASFQWQSQRPQREHRLPSWAPTNGRVMPTCALAFTGGYKANRPRHGGFL